MKTIDSTEEVWRDVVGYEGFFQVSNLGNIKSLARFSNGKNGSFKTVKEKRMGQSLNKYGYYKVSLRKNIVHKTPTLHQLVAQAFIPNPKMKPVVNHINGIKTDNRVENLEWCTVKENCHHAYKTGLAKGVRGEENHYCKINKETVFKIKEEYIPRKVSAKFLGDKYGISSSQVLRIIKGTRWKHINTL